jgi:hypothetical protein
LDAAKDRATYSQCARAREENRPEFEGWSDAIKALSNEDRYLLVMVAKAGATSVSSIRWITALATAFAIGVGFYIESPFRGGQQFCHAYSLGAGFTPASGLLSGVLLIGKK